MFTCSVCTSPATQYCALCSTQECALNLCSGESCFETSHFVSLREVHRRKLLPLQDTTHEDTQEERLTILVDECNEVSSRHAVLEAKVAARYCTARCCLAEETQRGSIACDEGGVWGKMSAKFRLEILEMGEAMELAAVRGACRAEKKVLMQAFGDAVPASAGFFSPPVSCLTSPLFCPSPYLSPAQLSPAPLSPPQPSLCPSTSQGESDTATNVTDNDDDAVENCPEVFGKVVRRVSFYREPSQCLSRAESLHLGNGQGIYAVI